MRRPGIFIWSLLAFICGCFVYVQFFWHAPAGEYQKFYGEKISFFARVASDPVAKKYDAEFTAVPLRGKQKILITARSRNEFKYGDLILVIGKLKEPQSSPDFDYLAYLLMQNISAQAYYPEIYIYKPQSTFLGKVYNIKHALYRKIQNNFPRDQAALLISFLSGDKQFLSADLVGKFNNIGVAHLIAVSGYKLTLILIWMDALIPYFGRRKVLTISVAATLFYATIANFAPAVMRAVIMSAIFILAKRSGRKNNLLNSLIFTAVLLLLENPLIIKYDLGFILSFSGIAGIVLYSPIINNCLNHFKFKVPHAFGIREIFVSTTAAQIATIPIMVKSFHVLPIIAPLANILLLPLFAPVILLGYIFLLPFFAITKFIVVIPLNYILILVNFFVGIPHAYVNANLSPAVFLGIYLLEAAIYFKVKS